MTGQLANWVEVAAAVIIGIAALEATLRALLVFVRPRLPPEAKEELRLGWHAGWRWRWSSAGGGHLADGDRADTPTDRAAGGNRGHPDGAELLLAEGVHRALAREQGTAPVVARGGRPFGSLLDGRPSATDCR